MRIGVVSDTHGRIRLETLERLQGVDCILHAGDFDTPEVMTALERVAPVYGVRGNNDWGSWTRDLPRIMRFTMGGVSFCMAHDRNSIPWDLKGVDVVIFGHTHHYEHEQVKGRLWLNPGSCSYPRPFRATPTMMLLDIEEGGKVTVFPVELAR
ncbi:MAG: metallophosphatase family protein [Oscillospiraceae bacterium]|jgi:putative phosphoesterase|nr:metallophosphoesterase family protein [Oscillospiraceae bacterium]MDE6997834.1 metallophosphatase family protein [Oscillospiraceae bacterium]